jgi:hypothetical protein
MNASSAFAREEGRFDVVVLFILIVFGTAKTLLD